MKRRLMIARALVNEPKLLLLDEPTAGVDVETRRAMWNFLREINQGGTTIILTTHYLEEAEQLCRHLAIIDDGCIVENDSMKNVLRKLKQEVFVLSLDKPIDDMSDIKDYKIEVNDPHEIEVYIKGQQTLNPLFNQLTQAGVAVISMRNKTNRLEELFFELTQSKQKTNGTTA
jgi:ABC-2 type transport system ATP-binding protein